MAKKRNLQQLINHTAERLQLLIRLKSADDNGYCTCVSCGAVRHYKDGMQGGHYIPRGKARTKLMEENIHPQCSGCNGFGMKYGTASQEYTVYMIDTYGKDFVDELLARKDEVKKWYRPDVEDLLADINEQIKFHEKRVI